MEWPGAGGSFPRSQGGGAHAGESSHDPFSAEATRDQEQMEMRKSEHEETGDHIMPYHLSHSAVRPTRTTDKALRENFHLPLAEVARKFGMCTTAFKKLCRKQGIMHWPHRALRSVEKKIASLRAEAKFTNHQGYIDEQVCKLEQKRESILSGIGLNAGWEEEVDEDNSNTSSLSSRSVRSDSPSLGDGSSSTHTTMTEDGSNTSADRPRRIHSMQDVRQYERLIAEDDDQSAQQSARSSLQRRSASYDSMVSFAEQGSMRARGFRAHQHESLEWGLQVSASPLLCGVGMGGSAPLGMWGGEMEGAAYSDRGSGRRDPREALEGLAVGMHKMGRPAQKASGGVFGAQAARGSNRPDLPQKMTGGEHDPPLESTVRELMVENWRMRAIIHNLACERDHWNKVSVDAEAEAAKYRLTARSLQGELAQVRQFSMGGIGGAMGGGMFRERQLYHSHALAEVGEQGGQSHVRGAGGASGRLIGGGRGMGGGGGMSGTYEQMGDAMQMLLRGDDDEETHDGDTQASGTPRHGQGGREDGLH